MREPAGFRLSVDARAGLLLSVAFLVTLAVTWQRWGNPLIDCGREMNEPLRLLRGERLYADVAHYYGPLAPHLNAGLYRLFGPSLSTLYAAGIAATALILALTYALARLLLGASGATVATLSVMWLCAFSPGGNYILPYAYAATYGLLLSLAALLLTLRALKGRALPLLAAGGFVAALALLAKTEMGMAALGAGALAAVLGRHRRGACSARLAVFLAPGLLIPLGVYGLIAKQVGSHALLVEGHLFYQNLSPAIIYFNKGMFGLDRPGLSLLLMLASLTRLLAVALAILWLADRRNAPTSKRWRNAALLGAGGAVALSSTVGWSGGPYLAMPLLLAGLLVHTVWRKWRRLRAGLAWRAQVVLVLSVFALLSLARIALRVRSGGSYSSYLLPASAIVFCYLCCRVLPAHVHGRAGRRLTARVVLALLTLWALGAALTASHRYLTRHTEAIATSRGRILTTPALAQAFRDALALIERRTKAGEFVAVVPEGTTLLFLADRRNPLHEEITVPGFIEDEERAIARLRSTGTRLVLVASRRTSEYGAAEFGRDYARSLAGFIRATYARCDGDVPLPGAGDVPRFSAFCR
jgi:hypothetical protein